MLFLAQLPTPNATSLFTWLGCLVCVLMLLDRGLSFWKTHMREEPRPSATYVTKTECDRLHTSAHDELAALNKRVEANEEYGKSRRNAIYNEFAARNKKRVMATPRSARSSRTRSTS